MISDWLLDSVCGSVVFPLQPMRGRCSLRLGAATQSQGSVPHSTSRSSQGEFFTDHHWPYIIIIANDWLMTQLLMHTDSPPHALTHTHTHTHTHTLTDSP